MFLLFLLSITSRNVSGKDKEIFLPIKITFTNEYKPERNSVEIFEYDDQNRLTSYEMNVIDTTYYSKLMFYYDNSGKLIKVDRKYRPHAKRSYEYIIKYETDNKVEIATESGMQFGAGVSFNTDYYILDNKGRAEVALLEDPQGSRNSIFFKYNNEGNLSEIEGSSTRTKYSYGNKKAIFKDVATSNWVMHYFINFWFDYIYNNVIEEREQTYSRLASEGEDNPLFKIKITDCKYNEADYPTSYVREVKTFLSPIPEKYYLTIEYKKTVR
ncbi:MAG: hypothetical protein ACLVKO_04250 [Dysgonomonas sp.]